MTRPPLIGLTTNKVPYSAEDQDVVYFLNITYVESIVQAGGVPLLLGGIVLLLAAAAFALYLAATLLLVLAVR